MATYETKYRFAIIDNITKPLDGINGAIRKALKPVRDLHNATQKLKKSLGFPQIGKAMGNIDKAFGGVSSQVKTLFRDIAYMGGAAAGVIGGLAWRTATMGDKAVKTAQKIGISTQAWTELSHAANMSGVSAEQLQTGMTKLNKTLFAAASGNKEAAYYFKAAGVNIYDQNGKLRAADEVLGDIADKFADPNFTSGPKRTALAMGMFGKSGVALIPMLAGGKAALNALRAEAVRLGITFTDADGNAAVEFMDSLQRLKDSLSGVVIEIGKRLMPVLTPLMNDVKECAVRIRELIGAKVTEWMDKAVQNVPALQSCIEGVCGRAEKLVMWLDEIAEAFGGWADVMPYVAGVLAIVKFGPLILSLFTLTKAVLGLGWAFFTSPIGIIVTLGYVLYRLAKWSSLVRAALVGLGVALTGYTIANGFSKTASSVGKLIPQLPKLKALLATKTAAIWASVKALWAMAAAWLATPIGQITAIVAALAALAYVIYDNWDMLSPMLEEIWESWKWAAGEIGGVIKRGFLAVFSFIVTFFKTVIAILTGDWDTVKTNFAAAWEVMKNVFASVAKYFAGIIHDIVGNFRIGFLEGLNAVLMELNPLVFVMDAFNAVFRYLTGIDLYDVGMELINGLWEGLKSMWSHVVGWLVESVNDLTSWMPDFIKDNLGLGNLQIPSPAAAVPAASAGGGEALDLARQREERRQAVLRAQANVYFDNVPPGVRVESQGFGNTKVERAPLNPAYSGQRMAGIP